MTRAEFGPELWGVTEIAEAFNVSKQAVWKWQRTEGFPEPTRLASGPVWDAHQIREWRRGQMARRRANRKF